MKNQYFGDINDYRKYGILRGLGGKGTLSTAVCWTLTPDDSRSDGSRIRYLSEPSEWSRYDPELFAHLRLTVIGRRVRAVEAIQDARVLPNSRFFDEVLTDNVAERKRYFDRFLRFARGTDLVFFDPDNGLGVKSVERGERNSSKYVYDEELAVAFRDGHSVLFYQHFPRRPRGPFVQGLVERLAPALGATEAYSFSTSMVVFLLFVHRRHYSMLESRAVEVEAKWGGQMRVAKHSQESVAEPWGAVAVSAEIPSRAIKQATLWTSLSAMSASCPIGPEPMQSAPIRDESRPRVHIRDPPPCSGTALSRP